MGRSKFIFFCLPPAPYTALQPGTEWPAHVVRVSSGLDERCTNRGPDFTLSARIGWGQAHKVCTGWLLLLLPCHASSESGHVQKPDHGCANLSLYRVSSVADALELSCHVLTLGPCTSSCSSPGVSDSSAGNGAQVPTSQALVRTKEDHRAYNTA